MSRAMTACCRGLPATATLAARLGRAIRTPALLLATWLALATGTAVAMEQIQIAPDGESFAFADSGVRFVPWGFNYDHDDDDRLLEDYWIDQWPAVEEDFRKMRQLGANVVRIHLQFGKFMKGPDRPNAASLDKLGDLLELAERVGLYLNLTGLGCYHKEDVPDWYDALSEHDRWEAQARFWEVVAARSAGSPAVFCYNLMNEPVVPGEGKRNDWLGPAFAGKHFVQFITLNLAGRDRSEVARAWIARLTAAIRDQDPDRLITVGLVPWSLDRPGLTSGFVPERIHEHLDFIAVHLYPETGKIDEAIETLTGFDVGKAILIEEIFPLRCSVEELDQFLERSREIASGWIGFYWGKTLDELRESNAIRDLLMRRWLELFQRRDPTMKEPHRDAVGDAEDSLGALVPGPFGHALNAERGGFLAPADPQFGRPPITVELWVNLTAGTGERVLLANGLRSSQLYWDLVGRDDGRLVVGLAGFQPSVQPMRVSNTTR